VFYTLPTGMSLAIQILTLSQNVWGWKGPLWAIYSNPPQKKSF